MLFLGLQVGKGSCGVGQADEGGEVEVGDDNLQGQDWQRCQAHPQTSLSSWRLEQLCAIIQLHQLWHIFSTTTHTVIREILDTWAPESGFDLIVNCTI